MAGMIPKIEKYSWPSMSSISQSWG